METAHNRENNLNFVRFFAASIVIYGHSQAVIGGPMIWALHGPLASLGVTIFFVVSGYLISDSWERNPNPVSYFRNRALRIFPALIVVVVLSALVVGPLFTSLPVSEYFSHPFFLRYLLNIPLYTIYALPAVFDQNPMHDVVNGSLWSLAPEFLCYILVAAIGMFQYRKWLFVAAFAFLGGVSIYQRYYDGPQAVIYAADAFQAAVVMTYFMIGAIIRHFRIPLNAWVAVALIAVYFAFPAGVYPAIIAYKWVLISYVVLTFGLMKTPIIKDWGSFRGIPNDVSYGLYLYAFPIQQMLYYVTKGQIGFWTMFSATFLLSLVCATISWRLVEAPALRLKRKESYENTRILTLSGSTQEPARLRK